MKILLALPTHNEELIIVETIESVLAAMKRYFPNDDWEVVVADNGSTDRTGELVRGLQTTEPRLRLWSTSAAGKGPAIRSVWSASDADYLVFMDADLSTELACLPALLEALNHADLAVGCRFAPHAHVKRSWFRERASRMYNASARAFIGVRTRDLQCGFKAIRLQTAQDLLPRTHDNGWFFDTELILWAERHGYRVAEIPVTWVETRHARRKSTVKFFQTSWNGLVHLWKLRQSLRSAQPE